MPLVEEKITLITDIYFFGMMRFDLSDMKYMYDLRHAGRRLTLPLIKLRRIKTQETLVVARYLLLRLDIWVVLPLSASFRVFVNSRTFCNTKQRLQQLKTSLDIWAQK